MLHAARYARLDWTTVPTLAAETDEEAMNAWELARPLLNHRVAVTPMICGRRTLVEPLPDVFSRRLAPDREVATSGARRDRCSRLVGPLRRHTAADCQPPHPTERRAARTTRGT